MSAIAREITKPTIRGSNLTKRERYNWKVKDRPGKFQMITKTKINIDPAYQREMTESKVAEIRASWSYVGCGTITVVQRDDGSYWAIDGQHRIGAALARSDISSLPCMVFKLSSLSDEAKAYLTANKNRKPLSSVETFRASVVSGDPIAIEVQRLLTSAGYTASKHEKARGVRAVGAMQRCLKADAEAFKRVWPAIVAAADGQAIADRVIQGLFWIERNRVSDSLGDPHWVRRVKQIGQDALMTAAAKASAYYASGGAQVWGPGMLLVINKRMQEKFRVSKGSE